MLRTLLALCLATASASAADKMLPREMEVGKVGTLWPAGRSAPGGGVAVKYVITEVGSDWVALRVETDEVEGDRLTILVRGIPTKGLVDGRDWKPAGTYKVEKTEKYKGKTVFSLRPEEPKDKK